MNRFLLVALLAWSTTAAAQSAGAQAEVLFRQGRSLMTAGKLAEACNAFDESQKLEPAVTTLLNLAGCREKQGQLATAWGLFLDAERQTRAATDDATKQLHEIASARAGKLEPRLSKLTINVPRDSLIDGLEILRDKDRVDPALWNRALPTDGGSYVLTARAPGMAPWSTEVALSAEGDAKTIEVPALHSLPGTSEPGPSTASSLRSSAAPTRDQPRGTSGHLVAIVVGVGAVGLLGGSVGFELSGESTYNDAKAEMMDQTRRDSLYDSANTKRYVAEGLATVGVAGAAVAVWLYLRGRRDDRSSVTTPLSFDVAPTQSGIVLMGSF